MIKNKLAVSICCNLITFYLTGLSNIWTQEQALKNLNKHPLQDQGFKLIAYNKNLLFMNDYLLIAIVVMGAGLIIFHKKRLEILFRWSVMLNILFAIRIVTVPTTILTRPVEVDEVWASCKTLEHDYNGLLGPFQVLFQGKMTCFDFIYSGHMVNTVITVLLLIKYVKLRFFPVFLWSLVLAESYFIIATRSHYTIDIIIAFLLTLLIWYIMDYREEIKELKQIRVE